MHSYTSLTMKRALYIFSFIAFIATTFISCGEDRTYEYLEMTKENQWTYSKMKEVYLWADSIKTPSRSEFFAATSKFFTTIKFRGDNASYFTDTVSLGTYGMKFALMRDPMGMRPSKVYALVLYVEKGSPAEAAGLERGKWITAVNGRSLSMSSASQLQQGGEVSVATEYLEYDDERERYFWIEGDTLKLPQSADIDACNICLDTVYTVRDQKIGYLLANSFSGDDFTAKAENALARFVAEDVSSVIIDLRYNSGGSLSNALAVANRFVPSTADATPFCTLKGNGGEVDTVYNYKAVQDNLSDKKLYFIIGANTKGTAEVLVNSLNVSRGANEVYIIGEKSAGANVMVEKIESPYGFAINPATAYVYSSDGNELPATGIQPDYEVNELGQVAHIYSLGSEQEYVLYNTLYLITNGALPSQFAVKVRSALFTGNERSFSR